MFVDIAFYSYFIDRIFGEFKYITHPIVLMGKFIKWFENRFYKDSIFRGFLLTLSLLLTIFMVTFTVEYFIKNIFVLSFIASTAIASKMLYDSVRKVLESDNPKSEIAMLVSRDTENLSSSDINKAACETYAENLSDGVIAPLFYLVLFGLSGVFIYKGINTLDSMVGYKNQRYEKFGKFSAKLDDVANYIPARITAVLIALLFFSKAAFVKSFLYGKLHESPNAGYPISAMAIVCGVKFGGDTSYFGKIKHKPFFGEGRGNIEKRDIVKTLDTRLRLDILVIILFIFWSLI